MYNPYVILNVKETASDSEIRLALKKQVNIYCGGSNDSRKNSDGEYLKEMFVKAARDLLSPTKRKKVDSMLANSKKEHGLEVYSEKSKKDTTEQGKSTVPKSDSLKSESPVKRKNNTAKVTKGKNEEKKNIKDVDVCIYNEDCIGLFRKIEWVSYPYSTFYDAGVIYVGIDSNYIGMKSLARNGFPYESFSSAGTVHTIKDMTYLSNCTLDKTIGFDDLRFKLYRKGLIEPFEIGKATASEMLEVMCYAADYFDLEKNNLKK